MHFVLLLVQFDILVHVQVSCLSDLVAAWNATVCSEVLGVKVTDKIDYINEGAQYPKSPLSVVIFATDKANFKTPRL